MKRKSDLSLVLIKRLWEPVEDQLLTELVQKHGIKEWALVSRIMNQKGYKRLGKQCRERWFNHLSPDVRKDPWTFEEDAIIILAHQKLGNKWTNISRLLTGRPANAIKNHWNSTLKRQYKENMSQYRQGKFAFSRIDLEAKISTLNSLNKISGTCPTGRYKFSKHLKKEEFPKSKVFKRKSKLRCRKKLMRYSESNSNQKMQATKSLAEKTVDDMEDMRNGDTSTENLSDNAKSQSKFADWNYKGSDFNFKSNTSAAIAISPNSSAGIEATIDTNSNSIINFNSDAVIISSNSNVDECIQTTSDFIYGSNENLQISDPKKCYSKCNNLWPSELKLEKSNNPSGSSYLSGWDTESEMFNNGIINSNFIDYNLRSSQSDMNDRNEEPHLEHPNNNIFNFVQDDDSSKDMDNEDDDDDDDAYNVVVDIPGNYSLINNNDDYEVLKYSNISSSTNSLFKSEVGDLFQGYFNNNNNYYNNNIVDWNQINTNEHFGSYYDHNIIIDPQLFWTV